MHRIIAAIFFLLFATPALAFDFTPDDLRALIKANDAAGLEKKLDEVQFAVQTESYSFEDQRELYEVFMTTDPVVEQFIKDWGKLDVISPHLPAATFWNLYHHLWIARGDKSVRKTYRKAMERMYDYVSQANPLAQYMFEKFPDFAPGSYAVLRMQLFVGQGQDLEPLVEKVFEHATAYEALQLARHSVSPSWGGSIEQMYAICEKFAGRVTDRPGYSVEICKIEAVYIAKELGKQLTWAQMMLDKMSEDQMWEQRLIDATQFRPDREIALAQFARRKEANLKAANIIEYDFGVAGTFAEEKARENAENLEKLKFDPLNPSLLFKLATYNIEFVEFVPNSPERQLAFQYLKRAAILGGLRSEIFGQIGYVHPQSQQIAGVFDTIIANERAVVLSNYGFAELAQHFDHIYGADFNFGLYIENGLSDSIEPGVDYAAKREELACPMVRSASLIEYMCVNNLADNGQCSVEGDPYGAVTAILAKARETSLCPQFLNQPVAILLFEEY